MARKSLAGSSTAKSHSLQHKKSSARQSPMISRPKSGSFHRDSPILLIVALILTALPGCGTITDSIASYPAELRIRSEGSSISVISDTQSPLWFEQLWIRSDDNEEATQALMQSIAADTSCTALFHLGDITGLGSFPSFWSNFDEKSAPIRQQQIPIYPAFGNHEYLPFAETGIENFVQRFPFASPSWYLKRIGSIAFILLNSNFSRLSDDELAHQQQWYTQTLRSLDADSTVLFTIVGCHHSPYTNSTIIDPSDDVRRWFVPPFKRSRKGILFLSGHSHASEYFRFDRKNYLVLGGGGGLLHPLLLGENERWHDEFRHESDRSFFHYVTIDQTKERLSVRVNAWNHNNQTVETIARFELQHP